MAEVKPNTEKKDKVEGAEGVKIESAAAAAGAAGPAEVTPAASVEVGVNKVDVILKEDHTAFIGGTWYTFKKDVKKQVSRDVFRVLKEAGMVKITY